MLYYTCFINISPTFRTYASNDINHLAAAPPHTIDLYSEKLNACTVHIIKSYPHTLNK